MIVWADFAHAQTITTEKHFGGVHYYVDGIKLPPRQAYQRVSINPEATAIFKSVRPKRAVSQILAASSCILVGFNIARSVSPPPVRKKLSVPYLLTGVGLIAASIPFYKSYQQKAEKAIALYNEGLPYTSSFPKPIEVYVVADRFGAGLQVRF
ncbi:MAG: hypothetical protein AB8F95_05970 [Bacteroidia bacterium]